MSIKNLDSYILREPPSCPHSCPYRDKCDSEDTGSCLLDEDAEDERYVRADAARDMKLEGE